MQSYLIAIGKTSTGYSAHCPDVPGCASVGVTAEETVANMQEALKLRFEGMADDGEDIPPSRGVAAYQDVLSDAEYQDYILAHVPIDVSGFATAAS